MHRPLLKETLSNGPYEVKLNAFYGPLDLLLYLIRRDEIDIYDIPIANITHQYLEYVKMIQMLDLEGAGEFLVMAATLMKIKSEMLLPARHSDIEEEDPRNELVRRLIEYQQYKELSSVLSQRETDQAQIFHRPATYENGDDRLPLKEATLFDLLTAFKTVMENMPEVPVRQVSGEEPSIEECMEYVLSMMANKQKLLFTKLIRGMSRMMMVVTFIALLELIKNKEVKARQAQAFRDIWIYKC